MCCGSAFCLARGVANPRRCFGLKTLAPSGFSVAALCSCVRSLAPWRRESFYCRGRRRLGRKGPSSETTGPNKVKGFQKRFQMARVGQDTKHQPSTGADDLAGDENETPQEAFELHAHDLLPDRPVGC